MSCFSNHFSNVIWSFFRAILRLMLVNYNNVIPNVRYLLVPIEILLFLNTWTSEHFLWIYYLISINYISLELCYDVNGNETLKGLRRDAKSYSLGQTTAAVAQQLQSWGVTTKKNTAYNAGNVYQLVLYRTKLADCQYTLYVPTWRGGSRLKYRRRR